MLPDLHVPALILHGVNDPRPLRGAADLATLLPRSRLVELPTGHSPWLEAPREVGELLEEFLVGASAGSGNTLG